MKPSIGDRAYMACLSEDEHYIEVCEVLPDQPREDLWIIKDQYGDIHWVELDGDTWVTTTEWVDMLIFPKP